MKQLTIQAICIQGMFICAFLSVCICNSMVYRCCLLIDKLCMVGSYFTPDTYANEHSARAARLAAGLCADLAKAIVSGRAKNGFALVYNLSLTSSVSELSM